MMMKFNYHPIKLVRSPDAEKMIIIIELSEKMIINIELCTADEECGDVNDTNM